MSVLGNNPETTLTGVNGVFYESYISVTSNYTVQTGKNAMAAGPLIIEDGVTITVPSGSTLTVV